MTEQRWYAGVDWAGVAPVTKKSGKSCIVIRRQSCSNQLANAMYHWARVAARYDPNSKGKYAALRGRSHSHGRALRSVADRLLNVACAMLKSGALFNPSLAGQNALAKRWGVPPHLGLRRPRKRTAESTGLGTPISRAK